MVKLAFSPEPTSICFSFWLQPRMCVGNLDICFYSSFCLVPSQGPIPLSSFCDRPLALSYHTCPTLGCFHLPLDNCISLLMTSLPATRAWGGDLLTYMFGLSRALGLHRPPWLRLCIILGSFLTPPSSTPLATAVLKLSWAHALYLRDTGCCISSAFSLRSFFKLP